MDVQEIKNIEKLLSLPNDVTIVNQKIKRLTTPGENYSCVLLSVMVTLKSSQGIEEISVVAKTVSPNEFIQKVFNTRVTFRNEIRFYQTIVPVLQDFQKIHGVQKVIDFFPKYYGSRFNLNNDSDEIDSEAVLLLQNLTENFQNLERTEGLDLDAAKLVLADLAQLHAVPLALKLQKPKVFEEKIKPYLSLWQHDERGHEAFRKRLQSTIDRMTELTPHKERILHSFDKLRDEQTPRELFATLTHNDCWVNNTMVKLEDGRAIKNKLIDFQICDYGSPAKDVIFFLFSSVKSDVVKNDYDNLIRHYHAIFISVLRELKCDTAQFCFDAFQDEIDHEAKNSQFAHIMWMLFPIFAPRGTVKDVSELSPESIFGAPSHLHDEKMVFVVEEFVKRNWI